MPVVNIRKRDYSVQEIRLFDVVHQAIADNKYLLLQNQVAFRDGRE